MNKDIMKQMGFEKAVELVEENKCPVCKKTIDMKSFADELSIAEYNLSGMCQACQDSIFGES